MEVESIATMTPLFEFKLKVFEACWLKTTRKSFTPYEHERPRTFHARV